MKAADESSKRHHAHPKEQSRRSIEWPVPDGQGTDRRDSQLQEKPNERQQDFIQWERLHKDPTRLRYPVMQEFDLKQSFTSLNFDEPWKRLMNLRRIVAGVEQPLTRHLGAMNVPETSSKIVEGPDWLISNSSKDISHDRLRTTAMDTGKNFADEDSRLWLLIRFIFEQHSNS